MWPCSLGLVSSVCAIDRLVRAQTAKEITLFTSCFVTCEDLAPIRCQWQKASRRLSEASGGKLGLCVSEFEQKSSELFANGAFLLHGVFLKAVLRRSGSVALMGGRHKLVSKNEVRTKEGAAEERQCGDHCCVPL